MSDNVEIVIGAKNTASKVLDDVGKSTSMLAKSFSAVTLAAAPLLAAFAAFKVVSGGITGIADAISDFDRESEAAEGLARAMKFAGDGSQQLMDDHLALADALEKAMNIESDVTMGLMRQASMLGVSSDQLDDVAKAAIGLSQAMGIDLEDALKKARLATEGHFESFNKLIPSMKDMATNEERLAAVMELSRKGFEDKIEASQLATGASERMNIALGNLWETIGEILSPLLVIAADSITYLAEAMTAFLAPAAKQLAEYFASWGPFVASCIRFMVESAIASFTFLEVMFTNLSTVAEYVLQNIQLTLITMAEDIKHIFTVVIPGIFEWFVHNMNEILTKGFNANLTSIPNLLERQITEGEAELQRSIGRMGEALGDEYAKKFNERIGFMGGSIKKELDKSIDLSMEDMTAVVESEKEKGEKQVADAKVRGKHSEGGTVQATESRLLTRGANSNPMLTAIEKNTKAVEENTKAERYKKYNPDGTPLGKGDAMQIEFVN